MTKAKQNILYTFVIIFTFMFCVKAFGNTPDTNAKGVFLPNEEYIKKTLKNNDNVITVKLEDDADISDNVGNINVVSHQKSQSETATQACQNSLKVAIGIASENGIGKLKYICTPFDERGNMQLRAFAFED